MKRRVKLILIFCISILVVTIIALATSYALFRLNVTKDTEFKVKVGNLELTIDDTNLGNTITDGKFVMSGLEPMKEQDGLALTGYNFKLKNTGTIDANYSIYLDSATIQGESKGRISDSLIKVNLTNNTTHASQTYTFSDLTNVAIDTGSLATNSENSYTLKMWLDYSADNTAQDKYFAAQIRVEGIQSNSIIHSILSEAILADNTLITAQPTLTTSSNETSDASGLYKLSVTNGFGGTNGDTYYFRGDVQNNKVKFAGLDWRVIRINEDGTVRLILDDSTDTNTHAFNSNYNDFSYMYYSNSQAKTDVETWYNANITGSNATKVATGNYFCETAKVKDSSSYTSGSATMTVYNEYTPDLKCQTDGNSKGLVNNSVGLINYDEVVLAGGYYGKSNNSYYLYKNYNWWTMSPAGVNFVSYACAWRVDRDGHPYVNAVYIISRLRPVINLKADVTVTKDSNGVYVVD